MDASDVYRQIEVAQAALDGLRRTLAAAPDTPAIWQLRTTNAGHLVEVAQMHRVLLAEMQERGQAGSK